MFLLLFLSILSLITFVISASYHRSGSKSLHSIQQCQYGRVCVNSCYSNRQLIDCNEQNVLKSVLFDPPFGQILPSTHLRLVRIDADDTLFNNDVTIQRKNLTRGGMNIHFSLFKKSTTGIICVDWHACSLDPHQ